MKRRHFVLLEILIAFALVSISIFPFLHYPFQDMRREMNLLYEMELEKLAQQELTDLQVRLYKKEIHPSWIFGEKETRTVIANEVVKVKPCPEWSKSYIKNVTINNNVQKIGDDNTTTVLLHLEINFTDKKVKEFSFIAASDIVVQKKGINDAKK
ncbi:MAG: hypothetical protein JSS30_05080 [Verrucomicrobia bacterium]|nr:hypothetical protein [Verrucomicrobiota bacterium]